jgi:hypothetical protein
VKNLLALPILLIAAQAVSAKCAPDFFMFSGVVTDKAGIPLAGALVGISWSELDGATGPALTMTDAKGRYSIPVAFDTYSGKGIIAEDACNQKIRSVSVSAYKGHLRSPYQRVLVGARNHITLPTSMVWLQADKKPVVRLIQPGG